MSRRRRAASVEKPDMVVTNTANGGGTSIITTTQNWGSVPIGSAPAAGYDRWVVVVFVALMYDPATRRGSNTTPTIGGSTSGVTVDFWEDSEADNHPFVQVSRKIVNSGTTTTLVTSGGNTVFSANVSIYTVVIPSTESLAVAGTGTNEATSGTSISYDVTEPAGKGAMFAGGYGASSSAAGLSYAGDAGVNENYEYAHFSSTIKGNAGYVNNPSGNTITLDISATATSLFSGAVSYQYA